MLPLGLKAIESGCFDGCDQLAEVSWGYHPAWGFPPRAEMPMLQSIDYEAFRGCVSLREIALSQSVAEIGREAFHYCTKLESLVIPDSVRKIGPNAFAMVPHVIYHGPDQSEVNWGR